MSLEKLFQTIYDMPKEVRQIKFPAVIHWFLALVIANILICFVLYVYKADPSRLHGIKWIPYNTKIVGRTIIHNSKCHIVDLHPWEQEVMMFYKEKHYISCSSKPLLTKILKKKDEAFLVVNKAVEKEYAYNGVSCCYKNVSRDMTRPSPDRHLSFSECAAFADKVKISSDVIVVDCYTEKNQVHKVYNNTHATTIRTDRLKKRALQFGKTKPPNVLLVGIDSVSKSNFARTLPFTSNYLKQMKWIHYKVYNKIGYNTYPNVMAMLTGRSLKSIKEFAHPKKYFANIYNIIWKDFQRLGYVTAYAEDMAEMNTFTYLRKGFNNQPTDFYFRHYTLATETLQLRKEYSVIYCAGPESYAERIFNIIKDFTATFSKQPHFGLFWMNSFSHDDINAPARMDKKIQIFLRDLETNGVMNNTIIIFLSDHGIRYGNIRHTPTGWLEERLPFLYFWVPYSFRKSHKREYENLRRNSKKLITPYDLYMTLQDILITSGLNYSTKLSISCRKATSLFKEVASVRSCDDACIDIEFCTCISYQDFNISHPLTVAVADFIVKEIRKNILMMSKSATRCAILEIENIRYSRIATNYLYRNRSATYMLIQLETKPRAVLEGTVRLENTSYGSLFHIEGEVHRLDLYKYSSWCVDIEFVKKYCICKGRSESIVQELQEFFNINKKTFI